jgi:cytoskeletal protein RodZ
MNDKLVEVATYIALGAAIYITWPVTAVILGGVGIWWLYAMVVMAYKEAKYYEKKARRETDEEPRS